MIRKTLYGTLTQDEKLNENEKAMLCIKECAELVGLEVIEGKTAFSITFMAEVMRRLRKKQEPKTGWNNHQIACMLADLFGDACACNYNGIDEWLSELCDFKDTCCPHPVGVACWEQFLKYSQSRYTECGYEVRDKGALQEPKEGHWILTDDDYVYCSECEDSYYPRPIDASWYYCPHCGAKMESEEQ